MKTPSDNQIASALGPYGVTPNPEMSSRIRTYVSLLLRWNNTVSLTTVTEIDEILRFHFGESLFAIPMLPVEKSRLADVGSGAGFPGIPLALARTDIEVRLLEPNIKKFAFLNEAVRELNLTNVIPTRSRMEEIEQSEAGFGVITARALGQFSKLLDWSSSHLDVSGGSVVLWLGEDDVAKVSGEKGWIWRPAVPIPASERRFIISGTPSP